MSELLKIKKHFRDICSNYYKKCKFHCLLSPDREEAAIFLGINKIISRALEIEYNNNNISSQTTIYPCSVLNIFECPYKRKDNEINGKEEEQKNSQILMLIIFSLSEIAFQIELGSRVTGLDDPG